MDHSRLEMLVRSGREPSERPEELRRCGWFAGADPR